MGMKNILVIVLSVFISFNMFNTIVLAEEVPSVAFNIEGKVEKGENIIISIEVNNVSNLYTTSVDYSYDTNELKVKSIHGGELIKSYEGIMELGGDTAKDGNRAVYQMTFIGKVNGISGSGNLAVIEAEVLKDCIIDLNEKNMKIKLVHIDDEYNISNMEYTYNPYRFGTSSDNGTNLEIETKFSEENQESETSAKDISNINDGNNSSELDKHQEKNSQDSIKIQEKGVKSEDEKIIEDRKRKNKTTNSKWLVCVCFAFLAVVLVGGMCLIKRNKFSKKSK